MARRGKLYNLDSVYENSPAQDVITCDICKQPAKLFCNSCQDCLCDDCVRKHKSEFQSLSHDIIPLLERKLKLRFPNCQEHTGRKCEAHCQECHTPVCIKCLTQVHKGHDAEELTLETRLQEMQIEANELNNVVIPTYQTESTSTINRQSEARAEFAKLQSEIKRNRKIWHERVDTIFDKIGALRQENRDKDFDALRERQNRIRNLISDMTEKVKQNEEILKSKKLSQVNNFEYKLFEYRKIPENISTKTPVITSKVDQGSELSIELGDIKASIIQQSKSQLELIDCNEERKSQKKVVINYKEERKSQKKVVRDYLGYWK